MGEASVRMKPAQNSLFFVSFTVSVLWAFKNAVDALNEVDELKHKQRTMELQLKAETQRLACKIAQTVGKRNKRSKKRKIAMLKRSLSIKILQYDKRLKAGGKAFSRCQVKQVKQNLGLWQKLKALISEKEAEMFVVEEEDEESIDLTHVGPPTWHTISEWIQELQYYSRIQTREQHVYIRTLGEWQKVESRYMQATYELNEALKQMQKNPSNKDVKAKVKRYRNNMQEMQEEIMGVWQRVYPDKYCNTKPDKLVREPRTHRRKGCLGVPSCPIPLVTLENIQAEIIQVTNAVGATVVVDPTTDKLLRFENVPKEFEIQLQSILDCYNTLQIPYTMNKDFQKNVDLIGNDVCELAARVRSRDVTRYELQLQDALRHVGAHPKHLDDTLTGFDNVPVEYVEQVNLLLKDLNTLRTVPIDKYKEGLERLQTKYNDLNREIDSKVARSKGEDNGYDILCYDDGDVSTPQESCSPPEDEPAPDQEEAEPAPKKIRREELPDNTEPNMDVTDDLQKPQPPTLCLSTAKTTQLTEPSQFDETLHAFAHVAVENDQDDFSKLYAAKAAVQKRMTDKQKRGFDKCWMKRSLKMQNTGKSKKHHEKILMAFVKVAEASLQEQEQLENWKAHMLLLIVHARVVDVENSWVVAFENTEHGERACQRKQDALDNLQEKVKTEHVVPNKKKSDGNVVIIEHAQRQFYLDFAVWWTEVSTALFVRTDPKMTDLRSTVTDMQETATNMQNALKLDKVRSNEDIKCMIEASNKFTYDKTVSCIEAAVITFKQQADFVLNAFTEALDVEQLNVCPEKQETFKTCAEKHKEFLEKHLGRFEQMSDPNSLVEWFEGAAELHERFAQNMANVLRDACERKMDAMSKNSVLYELHQTFIAQVDAATTKSKKCMDATLGLTLINELKSAFEDWNNGTDKVKKKAKELFTTCQNNQEAANCYLKDQQMDATLQGLLRQHQKASCKDAIIAHLMNHMVCIDLKKRKRCNICKLGQP